MKALTASEAAAKSAEALGVLDERVSNLFRRFNDMPISDEDEGNLDELRFNLDILHAVGTVLRINCR